MTEHHEGVALTSRAEAYLICYPVPDARRCGACGRPTPTCSRAPCPTRLDAMGVERNA